MNKNVESMVSIASYSFHKLLQAKMMDVFGYLESMKYRYGILNADIWNGFIWDMEIADFKKIRRAMDERGIELSNLCCDGACPWADDPDEKRELDKMASRMLDAAEILGAKTVRFDVGIHEDVPSEAQMEYVLKKFSEYAKRGEKGGFIIGPENHWGAARSLAVQKRMYAEINSKNYGILLHLGNWNLAEGETFDGNDREAAKIAVHTHVDYEHAMDAENILPPLIENGYKGVFGIEHHREINEYQGTQAQLSKILYALSKIHYEQN